MVINVCAAPARPDYDRALELWKYEEELLRENVLLRPSERLTLKEWEREVRGDGLIDRDRWTDAEEELEARKHCYAQMNSFMEEEEEEKTLSENRQLSSSPDLLEVEEMDVDVEALSDPGLGLGLFDSDSSLEQPNTGVLGNTIQTAHSEPNSLASSSLSFPSIVSSRDLDRHLSESVVTTTLSAATRAAKGSLPLPKLS